MTIEDLLSLVERRRSIRGYDGNREVPDEAVRTILDCARWAPSGGNGQPWEFVVVRDQAMRYKIADYYLKQMEQKREMDLAVRGTAKMTGDGFRHAPVHMLILGDPRVKQSYPIRTQLEKAESHFITGLANATLLIHLAVTALGLASQYVSDANSPYMETMLKVLLKIPEPLRIYHLVPIGYAKSSSAAPPRRTLDELIHYESYDASRYRDDAAIERFVKPLLYRARMVEGEPVIEPRAAQRRLRGKLPPSKRDWVILFEGRQQQ